MKNRSLLFGFFALTFGACMFMLTTSGSYRNLSGQSDTEIFSDGIKAGWSYMAQLRGNQVTGQVNPADVINARNQAKELKSSGAIGLNWTSMGPDNIAGRTRAIIIDNRDNTAKTIIAGSVSGGLWKSTTGGLTWNQVQTGNNVLNVSCMTQAPGGDIYVGTGETFSSERLNLFSGFIGQGIYKSTDGNTFTKLASTNPGSVNNPSADWAFVNKIAAGNNGVVLAATNNGLRFSSDGGQNWVFAKSGSQNLSGNSTEVKIGPDGAIAASVDNLLYISSNGTSDGFVLRSTGAGQDSLPNEAIGRIEVAFAPSDASTIYAMMVSDGSVSGNLRGQLRGIFVSRDKGETWKIVGPGGSVLFNVFGNSTTGINYGEYAGCIVVSPANPDKIFIGGVTVWEGTKIQETGFYQWQERRNTSFVGILIHSIAINPNNTQNIYFSNDLGVGVTSNNFESVQSLNRNYKTSMFYTVAYDDMGRTLGGTQGNGVLYLDRKGNTVENATQILGNFVGGTVDMSMINPAAVFYSSTGGLLVRSNDYGVSEANSFLYGAEVANQNSGNFITPFKLWESFNNVYSRDSVTFKATKNHNAGDVVIARSKNNQFPFKYTLPVGLNNGDTLQVKDVVSSLMFIGTSNAVYMSRNILNFSSLPSWDRIANITGVPSSLAFSSDANYVYVGTTDGKLYRIANVALAYDSIRADVRSSGCIINTSIVKDFGQRYVTSIAVDPKNDNHVIVTLGNYGNSEFVFRSTNALSSDPEFNPIQGNLPAMPVYSVIIEMNNTSRVILGTELGVYSTESLSASPTWSAENTGLGTIPVMMVRQQTISRPWIENYTGVNNFGAIYIATHGNGIFENRLFVGIDGPDFEDSPISKTLKVYPNPVQSEVNFSLSLSKNENIQIEIFNLRGTLVKSLETFVLRGDQNISVSADGLSNGTYLLKVTSDTGVRVAKFVTAR
ncbi:MAG: T9SS type A sorting domain-containing protein [Lentimicrobium sp.]|nr:T9SS type A sorting domain-containing protein [Lentimicrobium sp.]